MIPNPLLRHIYNNASDDVIRRGKKIFHTSGASLMEHDLLTERVVFRVRNDLHESTYRVTINNFIKTDNLNTRCPCSYKMGIVCKHEAAALLQLAELLQTGYFDQLKVEYDQKETLLRMRNISEQHFKLFSSEEIRQEAKNILKQKSAITILSAADDCVTAQVKQDKKTFDVKLYQNDDRYFETSCNCVEKKYPMCAHKLALFLHLLEHHGPNYFASLRNWDKEKNKLLALYGFSLEDDLRGKFEFAFSDGKLSMRVLNAGIKKLTDPLHPLNKQKKEEEEEIKENEEFVLLVRKESKAYPFITMQHAVIPFEHDKPKGQFSYPSLFQVQSHIRFWDEHKNIAAAAGKINAEELIKALKRDLPFGEFASHLDKALEQTPDADLAGQVWDYMWPKLSKMLELHKDFDKIFIAKKWDDTPLSANNIIPVKFSDHKFQLRLFITPKSKGAKGNYCIQSQIVLNESLLPRSKYEMLNEGLLYYEQTLFAAENSKIPVLLLQYPLDHPVEIEAKDWHQYLEQTLLKLDNRVIIGFDSSIQKEIKNTEPTLSLEVSEYEEKYIFVPVFHYQGVAKKWLDASPAIVADKGKVITYQRNEAAENTFLNTLKYLHPNMQERRRLQGFILPIKDALKKGWYFEFIDLMRTMDVSIHGFEQIKQARINPNRPVASIQFSTGIDWFTAQAEVKFGEEIVSLNELKKAITKSQNTIKLKDGTLGLITEDFLEQYGLMFKMGKVEGDTLKISKIHFATIEHLDAVKENEAIFDEIEEKKRKLIHYDFDKALHPLPDGLNAALRPYQESGFYWMNFLKETSWGGILADDMGLGKTVQTLTTLLHCYNENPKAKFLVVCPTTLMYNWEQECKKFTPAISFHSYHGTERKKLHEEYNKSNLIITTYGTLRSDIELLSRTEWDYVVLDESQAIKNPLSQASKATLRLNTKNRIALSGTPIQNNTFDLYAQMNFLNPGMLGSIDFFKNEFAIPIDKMQDEIAKTQLKKLIYPFLLRRTKEQVAPDLPEKTEMVLYCEMGKEQRKIYESYRHRFHSQIMGTIDEVGIEKSQMSILTGLMKLRQICDSPSLLSDVGFENHSVKLEELSRELTENVAQHKVLVFSQFLGMLDIIKKSLEAQKIPFVYFDGSTTTRERERAIKKFQEDEDCKVFLISLKAGGVGLNLTAADYVYIVDPWWNPAVEQQAIDRTHRIGQTKNIFAYRMICKDSIEEKILMLQERKLSLAKDLITDESGFLKKLSREDVEFLLS